MYKFIIPIILIILVLLVLAKNIVIVQQSRAYVVERLGAFQAVWGVGIHLKIPFIERVARKVSLKEQIADFPPQPVITKDNVTIQDGHCSVLPDHRPQAVRLRRGTPHGCH